MLNSFTNTGNTPFGRRTEGDMSTTGQKKQRVRSLWSETCAPFTIQANAKIPDISEERREERIERAQNLLKRPKHKERDFLSEANSDKLMSAPLTM